MSTKGIYSVSYIIYIMAIIIEKNASNNNNDASGITLDSDNRTCNFNYTTANNRTNIGAWIYNKTNPFVFENNIISITNAANTERMAFYFGRESRTSPHTYYRLCGIDFQPGSTSVIITEWYEGYTNNKSFTISDKTHSTTTGVRGYAFDPVTCKFYFYRNGIKYLEYSFSSAWKECFKKAEYIHNISYTPYYPAQFKCKFNFGENELSYSYSGFTPIGKLKPYTLSYHKLYIIE